MTDLSWGLADFTPYTPQDMIVRRGPSQGLLCAIALLLSAPVGLGALYLHPQAAQVVAEAPVAAPALVAASAPHRANPPAALAPLRHYAALLDPDFVSGTKSAAFGRPAALRSAFEPQRTVPRDQADAAPPPVQAQVAEAEVSDPADTQVVPNLAPAPPLVSQMKEIPLPTPRPDFALVPRSSASRRLAEAMPEQPAPVAPGVPSAPARCAPRAEIRSSTNCSAR